MQIPLLGVSVLPNFGAVTADRALRCHVAESGAILEKDNVWIHRKENCSPNKNSILYIQDQNFNKTHVNGAGSGTGGLVRDHANFKI